ncbi:Glyoxalase/bleomycin resistance protein/dioxygenase [Candidatus Protofrankia datiscae]|uniref:Glyoxalase/bleomycin resistance protein/dioxygenase n=1 Tax=Candidatus Protofrankia datiscae TaxID=2716812 RepID=F8B6A1_9ACTN|nr:Glyoxalase/bleomycin resistance protein/dioxygenase [Candidatus Protofrankia datiscae]
MIPRVQLALNVSDVDAAVDFYTKLFGAGPAKRRPGYANFAIDVPPLKLVLIENPRARGAGVAGALNHLGVEVTTSEEVTAATTRLAGAGLDTATEENSTCCYAVQDKVWVDDPDGAPWEIYTVLADVPDRTDAATGVGPALRTVEPGGGPGSACACGPGGDCAPTADTGTAVPLATAGRAGHAGC